MIGVDFLSHQYGAQSAQAINHLKKIDRDMGQLLGLIRGGEKTRRVTSLLTSDHGFAPYAQQKIKMESVTNKISDSHRLLNEARMASVYFTIAPEENTLVKTTRKLFTEKNIEIISYKLGQRVRIIARDKELYFDEISTAVCNEGSVGILINNKTMACSDQLPVDYKNMFYPFFIENVASFFKTKTSPDLIMVPNRYSYFESIGVGFHGGPTEDETIVPLLIRNAKAASPEQIPANWKLLKFINE